MPNVSPHQSSPFAPSVAFDGHNFWMTWLSNSGDNGIFWATSSDGQNCLALASWCATRGRMHKIGG